MTKKAKKTPEIEVEGDDTEILIDDGDKTESDVVKDLRARIADLERDVGNWKARYQNASAKVDAFTRIRDELVRLDFVVPNRLK